MIDKVLPGQRVTADTTNKMIDVCNGLQTPSESFVNTPNGTLTPVPGYQARYTYLPVPETVLQAKRGPALKMTSRGATRADDLWSQDLKDMTWFCFLGPDTAALTQCLPSSKTPDSIWLGNSDTALFAEVTDSMLSSLRPAGYYADLAAYGEDSVAVKEVKLTKSDDDEDPGKNVLVICGASLDSFGKIQEDSRYSEYDETEVVNTVLFAKINEDETPFLLPLKALSSTAPILPGDSQLSALLLSSVVVRELSGKSFIELHEFHEDNTKEFSDVSADGVDVLIRNPKGPNDGRELQYVSLSSLSAALSGGNISGDANVESLYLKSIETKKDSDVPYHLLYGFDSPTMIPADSLSSGGYQVVLRDSSGSNKQIVYSEVSSLAGAYSAISGDTNVSPSTGKSIETLSSDSGKFHRLYNWTNTGADQSHVISAAFGETRYFPFQDGTGTASDLGEAAHILTRPRTGEKELHYDAYGIRIPKVSPTDITEELHELILSGGGTDVSAIRQIVLNTLDDPEAKEPLSSNLNDCFWVQGGNRSNCYGAGIGNSTKTEVVSLDNMKLKADGTNQITLDWGGGKATDSTGKESLTWEGRGLLDSNEKWTVLWDICQLWDKNNNPTVDWENGALKVPASGNNSVDWKSGVLYDPNNGNVSLNWDVGYAQDPMGSGATVNWNTGQLWANDSTRTLNWKTSQLIGNWRTTGNFTIGGNGSTLTIGSTTITEAQLQQLLALLTAVPQALNGI